MKEPSKSLQPPAPGLARLRSSRVLTFVAGLGPPLIILNCYLIWWIYTVARYFDPSPRLWLSSLGLSAIIGTALYLSTAHGGAKRTVLSRWQVTRLFLMPFCVSSFAALIKDRGFVLVFHPSLRANLEAIACCLTFVAAVTLAKRLHAPRPSTRDLPLS
ncbi:MAG: hypothetical protein U0230_27510 [Polyangiales bacterium]